MAKFTLHLRLWGLKYFQPKFSSLCEEELIKLFACPSILIRPVKITSRKLICPIINFRTTSSLVIFINANTIASVIPMGTKFTASQSMPDV